MITPTYGYYVDWNDDGDFLDAGEDITAYVLTAEWQYGRDYASQLTGRSTAGSCSLVLLNTDSRFSQYNSLSPLYGLIKPGLAIKITMDAGSGPVTMWRGSLANLQATPGFVANESRITLTGQGPLADIAKATVSVATQKDILTGDAVTAVLDKISWDAGLRSIDSGQGTMGRWWTGTDVAALQALQDIADTEAGFIRETKDGKIAFEDRAHRSTSPHDVSQATYSSSDAEPLRYSELAQDDASQVLQRIFNVVTAQIQAYNISQSIDLWTLTGEWPFMAAGADLVIIATFPSATAPSNCVAVQDWTNITWTANGTRPPATPGDDESAYVTCTAEKFDQTCKMTFHNSQIYAVYLSSVKVQGIAVLQGDPLQVTARDQDSIDAYGERDFPFPGKFLTAVDEGQGFCDHILALSKDPAPILSIGSLANRSQDQMNEALRVDVSDRITIASGGAGSLCLSGDYFVESVSHTVGQDHAHMVRLQCSPVSVHTWEPSAPSYDSVTILPSADSLGDTGNPSGASGLQILIPPAIGVAKGDCQFRFNSDTTNRNSLVRIEVYLSVDVAPITGAMVPAQGPYKIERDAHPDCTLETGYCAIVAGGTTVMLAPTGAAASVENTLNRVLLIYVATDSNPDAQLAGQVIGPMPDGTGRNGNVITLTAPFNKGGVFTYCIVKRWFDCGGDESSNTACFDFDPPLRSDNRTAIFKSTSVHPPAGLYWATASESNVLGVGTRMVTAVRVQVGADLNKLDMTPDTQDGLASGESFVSVLPGSAFLDNHANPYTIQAGCVSWTGPVKIRYQSVTYTIADGVADTFQKYVYWRIGASSLTASTTFITTAGYVLIGINSSGTWLSMFNATYTTGDNLAPNSVDGGTHIIAGTVTASYVDAGCLTAITAFIFDLTAVYITGWSITGATITGGTIQTGTSGERFVITGTSAIQYNSSNVPVFSSYSSGSGGVVIPNLSVGDIIGLNNLDVVGPGSIGLRMIHAGGDSSAYLTIFGGGHPGDITTDGTNLLFKGAALKFA